MKQLKHTFVIALLAGASAFAQSVTVNLPPPPMPHVRVQVAPAPAPVVVREREVVREVVVVRKGNNGKHKGHHKH